MRMADVLMAKDGEIDKNMIAHEGSIFFSFGVFLG